MFSPPTPSNYAESGSRLSALLLGAVLLLVTALARAEAPIAVVYPDIGETYRAIFEKIVEGIEDRASPWVAKYAVKPGADSAELKTALHRQDARVVIALGRQGMKAVTPDRGMAMVVGGVVTMPESEARGLSVVSLSPDPALLFARLKALMPAAKRVFVVYDPRSNAWLMRPAKEAALAQGLELVAYEAQDLRGAMQQYQAVFAAADSRTDALWLPQDTTTVEERSVLPVVLQESWNRSLAIFSSSFGHVRRGVLFALYPDNVALGKSLAGLALGILASGNHGGQGMMPLRDVRIAVNLRTAQHIGLDLSRQQPSFDLVFPEP
jgi:putative ABC transport system substrate-binding protein